MTITDNQFEDLKELVVTTVNNSEIRLNASLANSESRLQNLIESSVATSESRTKDLVEITVTSSETRMKKHIDSTVLHSETRILDKMTAGFSGVADSLESLSELIDSDRLQTTKRLTTLEASHPKHS